ncbi:MAG: hypothetical protein IPK60_23405 [Sandaracinaceae bacterium]|jgi:uncharacterized membrane protein YgcG|nr:hypothetical protein [Sandaracinaceae bacterium]
MKTLALMTVTLGLFISACGGGSGNRASVTPGPMPTGGSFSGVWFSPQYGRLDMVQTGASIVGEYTKDERHGRIEGTAQGNVMRFQWTESRELIVGRPTVTRGRGYFQYVVDGNEVKLVGQWGHDNDEVGGGPWNAVRSGRLRPHLSTDPDRPDNSDDENSGRSSGDGDSDGQSTSGGETGGNGGGSTGGGGLEDL